MPENGNVYATSCLKVFLLNMRLNNLENSVIDIFLGLKRMVITDPRLWLT